MIGRAAGAAGLDLKAHPHASGFKAHGGNSLHGGSKATGGYGHGQALDITTADGDASAWALDRRPWREVWAPPPDSRPGPRPRSAEEQVARNRGCLAKRPHQASGDAGQRGGVC
jgi:hypothetical protein